MVVLKRTEKVFRAIIVSLSLCRFLEATTNYAVQNYNLIYHLPGLVEPEKYELVIFTNLDGNVPQFHGRVSITIQCIRTTKEIVLNKKGLQVSQTDVSISSLTHLWEYTAIRLVESIDKYDRLRITLVHDLVERNRYVLTIKFSSIAPTDGHDSGYIVNQSKHMAFTKLNVVDARLVFPCFDQINMKATYKLSLGHAKGINALTNSPFVRYHEIPDEPGWILDEFAETVRMAPFSVGIALLTFSHKDFSDPSSPILIRVWADESIIDTVENINKIVFKVFKFFSKLFLLAHYPLGKFDLVVFSDNSIDKVESYGIIFISEMYVSNALKGSESSSKFQALSEICISISQQWIGHSVTMSSFDEIWLHEGLNLFLQTMCVNEVFSDMEYTYSESNVVISFLHLLRTEENQEWVFVSSKNPTIDVGPNDYLSKQKAFHLIRMMNLALGPTLFRKFLTVYLTKYKSANTSLETVWHVFDATTNKEKPDIFPDYVTVKRIMQSWTSRKGHPLVTVTRDYETGKITLKQKPFMLYEEIDKENPNYTSSWMIPLTYTTQKQPEFEEVVVHEWLGWRKVLENINVQPMEWIIFSLNLDVMVRVNYDATNWDMIQETLLDQTEYLRINISTRVRLVSDMFVLAEAGEVLYTTLFHTMNYLSHEKFFQPWKVALDEFGLIRTRLIGTKLVFESYQKYVGDILETVFPEFLLMDKYWDLHYQRRQLKLAIIEASCLYEVYACVDKSLNIIENWNSSNGSEPKWPNSIPHAVNTIIHCQKVKRNNDYWKELWKQFSKKNTSQVVQKCILEALGCSRDITILNRYLELSIDAREVSRDESLEIFRSLVHNDKGYNVMKDFFMNNYERIRRFHGGTNVTTTQYLKILLSITTKEKYLNSLIDFASSKNLDVKSRSVKRYIANSRRHIMWYQRHKFSLKVIFKIPMRD